MKLFETDSEYGAREIENIKIAAEQGDMEAQYNLGKFYDDDPQELDKDEAVSWYRLAAEQGHAIAQNNLGVLYDDGIGVRKNQAEAARWYRLSAEQGNATAQYHLGLKHFWGEGVPEDDVEAYAWFNMASAQGEEDATELKENVTGRMTRTQIAEAQKLARKYWKAYGPEPENK